MSFAIVENAPSLDAELKMTVLKHAAQIVMALQECSDALREEALVLMKQLADPALDDDERYSTAMLLSEILFPQDGDSSGSPGLDLEEAEEIARQQSNPTVAKDAMRELGRLDEEESLFAERLRAAMTEKNMTQQQLAQAVGVGQPAISMMLQRACRPQQRTVKRIAEALGVAPKELWPTLQG